MGSITVRTALLCTAAFLTALGIVSIYASSAIPGANISDSSFFYLKKHAFVALIGFSFIFLIGHIKFSWINKLPLPLILLSITLLFLTLVAGHTAKGATRWLHIFGISIQAAEIAKLALVVFLAKNLSRPTSYVNETNSGLFTNGLTVLTLCLLLLLQPDFGTTALLVAITCVMLITAGLSRRNIGILLSLGFVSLGAAIIVAPYRLKRLITFLNPWDKFKDDGFQIIQSFLGFQNGGLLGLGLGESRQKLYFLPEAHTDFILAVIGEELGLLGVLLVCVLFAYLAYLGWQITIAQKDTYRKYLAFGLTLLLTGQACINLGVCMGVFPTKGMTLPFISMGSNSLFVSLFAVALLARIAQEIDDTIADGSS